MCDDACHGVQGQVQSKSKSRSESKSIGVGEAAPTAAPASSARRLVQLRLPPLDR